MSIGGGYKLERERPSGSINFRSNYRQDQSSLIVGSPKGSGL